MVIKEQFDVVLGHDIFSETQTVMLEEDRFKHELLIGPSKQELITFAALPRIEQDIEKLVSGEPVGIFILSEDLELMEAIEAILIKHKVSESMIHNLTPLYTTQIATNPLAYASISDAMTNGGIVLVHPSKSIDPFFRFRLVDHFISAFSMCAFRRSADEKRIPVFLMIETPLVYKSDEELRSLLMLGRRYRVGLCLIDHSFTELANEEMLLRNIHNFTSFYEIKSLEEKWLMENLLCLEPIDLDHVQASDTSSFFKFYSPLQDSPYFISYSKTV
ncbi:hypothetical protein ABER99_21180 [Paenibacillus glucanolyticus]|uniref:Uncharacterized protein n=1 Tax=Paenibacillus glucanolyticus TaxID=59843 RepID=A0A163G8I2_9BACL|nr:MULTISPECIES: hypothetical protein [Paenibacillus]KZS44793.1 hypothetical protein AWU65_02035 [Paenibacillus glucanolyticus]MDH6675725.1 hypothetical protein [Paenibacillus sp. LBL]OMF64771.1 hypothetical protein BK142_31620 [Paenibacillus glucanolyticus]